MCSSLDASVEVPPRPVIQITRSCAVKPLGRSILMPNTSLAVVFIFAFTAGVLHGCGGGSTGAKATPHCLLNSDCKGKTGAGSDLVCALGYCVSQCAESIDCPSGQLCIKTDNGSACRAPEVAKGCKLNSDCTTFCTATADDAGVTPVCPIICGGDSTCRTQCKMDVDCPGGGPGHVNGQKCTKSGACVDPVLEAAIYDPTTNDFKPKST